MIKTQPMQHTDSTSRTLYIITHHATALVIPQQNPDNFNSHNFKNDLVLTYRGADKSLALPGRKQATATENFDVHISYL